MYLVKKMSQAMHVLLLNTDMEVIYGGPAVLSCLPLGVGVVSKSYNLHSYECISEKIRIRAYMYVTTEH